MVSALKKNKLSSAKKHFTSKFIVPWHQGITKGSKQIQTKILFMIRLKNHSLPLYISWNVKLGIQPYSRTQINNLLKKKKKCLHPNIDLAHLMSEIHIMLNVFSIFWKVDYLLTYFWRYLSFSYFQAFQVLIILLEMVQLGPNEKHTIARGRNQCEKWVLCQFSNRSFDVASICLKFN